MPIKAISALSNQWLFSVHTIVWLEFPIVNTSTVIERFNVNDSNAK